MGYQLCPFTLNIVMSNSRCWFLVDVRSEKNHSKSVSLRSLEYCAEDIVHVEGGVFSCLHKNYYSNVPL